MIVDLPDTTTNDINKRIISLREEGGAITLGRVLTLVVAPDCEEILEDAVEAAFLGGVEDRAGAGVPGVAGDGARRRRPTDDGADQFPAMLLRRFLDAGRLDPGAFDGGRHGVAEGQQVVLEIA